MELRAFAQQVLRSTDLEEKLSSPDSFTDQAPGDALTVAGLPGRPRRLPLVPTAAVPPAPTPRSLVRKDVPGQTLHTFAHHELQALELMALALLRFPDAPTDFRQGLARIIQDEQRHFRLYQARAEHWGTGLGDVGASHFFWDTVADIDSPQAFLAALSLTYEQANLDFAHGYSGHGVTGSHTFGRILSEAIDGDLTRFDVFANVPWFPFPGGRMLRVPYSVMGSWWYGLRDRLGV